MRKILLGFMAVAALSGCSANWDNSHKTSCRVGYSMDTFPARGEAVLLVDKTRYDRFGRMSVHPKKGQSISFFGSGWLNHGEYKNIDCR